MAAATWTRTAASWGDVFTDIQTRVQAPGGLPWSGRAADAAGRRSHSDRLTVIAASDRLHEASAVAMRGAGQIEAQERGVLDAVAAAEDAGFVVGEDYSISRRDPVPESQFAAKQAQAQVFADGLRWRVAEFVAVNRQVAAHLTSAAEGVGTVRFADDADDVRRVLDPLQNGAESQRGLGRELDAPVVGLPDPAVRYGVTSGLQRAGQGTA